jgi:hypothetical protein
MSSYSFSGETMTVEPTPVKKTPWLFIALGAIGVLCLCAIVIGAAILAFFIPTRVTTVTEAPFEVIPEQETALPTTVPSQESTDPSFAEAAPAGTAVDIGNEMTLTILDATRPADEIVANGSVLNATAPEGEEFMQVDVQVTCNSEPGAQCSFYPTVMKAVLSDGSRRDLQIFIEGVDDWDTAIGIEGGATEQGFLLFIVPKSETDLLISYQADDQPVYMRLP